MKLLTITFLLLAASVHADEITDLQNRVHAYFKTNATFSEAWKQIAELEKGNAELLRRSKALVWSNGMSFTNRYPPLLWSGQRTNNTVIVKAITPIILTDYALTIPTNATRIVLTTNRPTTIRTWKDIEGEGTGEGSTRITFYKVHTAEFLKFNWHGERELFRSVREDFYTNKQTLQWVEEK